MSQSKGGSMLYGGNCLVLFYEGFISGYSYTRLGYVENPDGLADALGRGEAHVVFSLAEGVEEARISAPYR